MHELIRRINHRSAFGFKLSSKLAEAMHCLSFPQGRFQLSNCIVSTAINAECKCRRSCAALLQRLHSVMCSRCTVCTRHGYRTQRLDHILSRGLWLDTIVIIRSCCYGSSASAFQRVALDIKRSKCSRRLPTKLTDAFHG